MILERLVGLDDVWRWTMAALERATVDRKSPFRWPIISTVDPAGRPRARTVGLRRFGSESGTLAFYTDRRTPKVSEIEANPSLALTFLDTRQGVQLRLNGEAAIVSSGPAWDEAWSRLPEHSRLDYQSIEPPGNETAQPIKEFDPSMGSKHFALVEVQLEELEWLHLEPNKHRRAQFMKTPEGWRSYWVIP